MMTNNRIHLIGAAELSDEVGPPLYKGLMFIERCFRSLKRSQIQLMPMFHWASHHIESHVKICVLALLLERVAELWCGQPWHRILHSLERLKVTDFF